MACATIIVMRVKRTKGQRPKDRMYLKTESSQHEKTTSKERARFTVSRSQ